MFRRGFVRALVAGFTIVWSGACSPAPDDPTPVIEIVPQDHFSPTGATIAPGDDVLWSNQDDHAHRLELGDGGSIIVEPGDVVQTSFPEAGVWLVHDAEASQMLAVIEVLSP